MKKQQQGARSVGLTDRRPKEPDGGPFPFHPEFKKLLDENPREAIKLMNGAVYERMTALENGLVAEGHKLYEYPPEGSPERTAWKLGYAEALSHIRLCIRLGWDFPDLFKNIYE